MTSNIAAPILGTTTANDSAIAAELNESSSLTSFRNLEIHAFRGDDCPLALREIGRLREAGFRSAGAGRGGAIDLDDLDNGPHSYDQLIAWDPERLEIVAMYRYQLGSRAVTLGNDDCLRTARLFDYAPAFRRDLLPTAIELGRSVVNRAAKRHHLGFFAVWAGLGALLKRHPETQYFFGNVSLYQSLNATARDLLIAYLEQVYAPPEVFLRARPEVRYQHPASGLALTAVDPATTDTPEHRIQHLRQLLAVHGEPIPPIVQSYLALSNDIWCGETVHDQDFGDALEIGIIVPVANINAAVKKRFIA